MGFSGSFVEGVQVSRFVAATGQVHGLRLVAQVWQDPVPAAPGPTGAEREDLWAQMVEVLPQYEEYRSRTERQIPVVVLGPLG